MEKVLWFYDKLDGKYSFGVDEKRGSQTVFVHNIPEDKAKVLVEYLNNYKDKYEIWLYPEDLGTDNILNICKDGDWFTNWYTLPDNWKDIVTNDKGVDGKASIHDIMI